MNWDENQAPLGQCFRMEDSAQPRTNLVMERVTDQSLANIVCSSRANSTVAAQGSGNASLVTIQAPVEPPEHCELDDQFPWLHGR